MEIISIFLSSIGIFLGSLGLSFVIKEDQEFYAYMCIIVICISSFVLGGILTGGLYFV